MTARERLSANLKRLRARKKWTQAEVSERLGVASNTVARWERGHLIPPPEVLDSIAELYGVDVQQLFRRC